MILSFKRYLSQWYEMLGDILGPKSLLHCASRRKRENPRNPGIRFSLRVFIKSEFKFAREILSQVMRSHQI